MKGMNKQKSGSMGDAQKQRVTTAAPGKVGAHGLGGVRKQDVVRGGPRKQKSGSSGG